MKKPAIILISTLLLISNAPSFAKKNNQHLQMAELNEAIDELWCSSQHKECERQAREMWCAHHPEKCAKPKKKNKNF